MLPQVPIASRAGLQIQRPLSRDVCLREGEGSHIRVNEWNNSIPFHVSSHLWVEVNQQNVYFEPDFNWRPMIKKVLDPKMNDQKFCFPAAPFRSTRDIFYQPQYQILLWERDDWTSGLDGKDIAKIHQTLPYPEPVSMLQIFQQKRAQNKLL